MKTISSNPDFNDMLQTFRMMKRMGSLSNLLNLVPGLSAALPEKTLSKISEKETRRIEAIILSMTPRERSIPRIIDFSRTKRIAVGAGTTPEEVNNLLRQVQQNQRR